MFHFADIQKVFYNVLVNDTALNALVFGRVFDEADHNSLFPYVTIGESVTTPDDSLDLRGALASVTVHTWSRSAGMKQTQEMMNAAMVALDNKRFPLPATQWVECRFENAQTLRDLDGITRHGVIRFRVRTFDVPMVAPLSGALA